MTTNEDIIKSANGSVVAILHLRDYYSPSWAPPKAEIWWAFYNLVIPSCHLTLTNRFITERYCISKNGRFLCIEEFCADTKEETEQQKVGITIIDTVSGQYVNRFAAKIANLWFEKIEGDVLYYAWSRKEQPCVWHQYELTLSSVLNR